MATGRAYWKGYLKLSLVTCPVALYPASSQADKTHFHQINRKTGNRLRQQMVDEETGKTVGSCRQRFSSRHSGHFSFGLTRTADQRASIRCPPCDGRHMP